MRALSTPQQAPMLGLVLGTDEGIVHALPGDTPTTELSGPPVTALDYGHDTGIAAAPGHGAWMHRGRGWEQVWEGDARSVRVAPDGTYYIGTAPPMVYRSEDRGKTWRPVPNVENVLRHHLSRSGSMQDPAIAGIVFPESGILIGVRPMGTWASRDHGGSWMPRAEGLDPDILGVWEHPERRDRLYATAESGFYRSDDGGFSWIQSLSGLDRSYGGDLGVVAGTPDTLVLSVAHRSAALAREAGEDPDPDNAALFRSDNGGVAWQRIMLEDEDAWPEPPLIAAVPGTLDMLFVLAGDQAWGSHDRGEHWMPVADGLPRANAFVAAL